MKRFFLLIIAILLAAITNNPELKSQSINITGKATNSDGAPVPQARVRLLNTGLETFTDASGNFSLFQDNTGAGDFDAVRSNSYFDGRRLFLNTNGERVHVRIIDLSGREIVAIIPEQKLNGYYMVNPGAYINSGYQSFYILQSLVGEELSAFKFFPPMFSEEDRGLVEISNIKSHKKSVQLPTSTLDTLVITHDIYKDKKIPIDCYVCSFGDIMLSENVPEAPTNLTGITPNSNTVSLTWIDNSDNETGFKVEKSSFLVLEWSAFDEIGTVSPNITEFTDTDVIQGRNYKYRVYAYNDNGISPYSSEIFVTPPVANPISISGPTSSTGIFNIEVTYSWPGMLGSTSDRFVLEESNSPTGGFVTVDNSPWGQRPQSYTFSLTKSTGTYYYRARAYNSNGFTGYTDVISVSVNTPVQKAYLKIVNNSHYPMIDIQLNNQQLVGQGNGIVPGGDFTFEFDGSGNKNFVLGVGFWDGSYRNVWFVLSGNINITVGATSMLSFNNPTIEQIMSGFSSFRDWKGEYWDSNLNMHYATFRFNSNGSWTLYDDGTAIDSGNVLLASWPDYAVSIMFKLCHTCEAISMPYPFGQFFYNNGPPSWPTIQYTAQ